MHVARNVVIGMMVSGCLFAAAQKEKAQTKSPSLTALPIVFTHGIDAAKAHIGDTVTAKTMQIVLLPGGSQIPKGTIVLGHIVDRRSFSFDPAPYAIQRPSVLAIRLDTLMTKAVKMNVLTSVRALAAWSTSDQAMKPQYIDEKDIVGTMYLIGGDSYRNHEKPVTSQDGDIVGYHRSEGVFARLLPSEYSSRYSHFECEGSGTTEVSVAIFSPSACGLYGLPDAYLADNGLNKELGTFRLESRRHTVKLYAQTTALLQMISAP